MGDEAHQFGARGCLEVEFLLESRDVVLLSAQLILVLVIGVFDLGQVLLHHVPLPDQIVDILLLFVCLFVDPFDFTGQGGYCVCGGHFFVKGHFTSAFEGIVFAHVALYFAFEFGNGFLVLADHGD